MSNMFQESDYIIIVKRAFSCEEIKELCVL